MISDLSLIIAGIIILAIGLILYLVKQLPDILNNIGLALAIIGAIILVVGLVLYAFSVPLFTATLS